MTIHDRTIHEFILSRQTETGWANEITRNNASIDQIDA